MCCTALRKKDLPARCRSVVIAGVCRITVVVGMVVEPCSKISAFAIEREYRGYAVRCVVRTQAVLYLRVACALVVEVERVLAIILLIQRTYRTVVVGGIGRQGKREEPTIHGIRFLLERDKNHDLMLGIFQRSVG